MIWVYVSAEGKAARTLGLQPSNDPSFHIAAIKFARDIQYKPADKNGQPIAAWVRVVFRPKPH